MFSLVKRLILKLSDLLELTVLIYIYTVSSLEEVQCHNSLGTFNVEGLPFEPVLSDVSLNI
jgi:hypothetical protein